MRPVAIQCSFECCPAHQRSSAGSWYAVVSLACILLHPANLKTNKNNNQNQKKQAYNVTNVQQSQEPVRKIARFPLLFFSLPGPFSSFFCLHMIEGAEGDSETRPSGGEADWEPEGRPGPGRRPGGAHPPQMGEEGRQSAPRTVEVTARWRATLSPTIAGASRQPRRDGWAGGCGGCEWRQGEKWGPGPRSSSARRFRPRASTAAWGPAWRSSG